MPPIPPIPPPPGMGAAGFFSGISLMSASVVKRSPAMLAAFSSAVRATYVGSTMPAFTMSTYSAESASKPSFPEEFFTRSQTIAPSTPAFCAI